MKRREFGRLAGASTAAVAIGSAPAAAQSATPDPSLLTTTLTPLGAERAGNADGSIPAWTGGLVGEPGGPADIRLFTDEQPLLTVNSSNLAQYQDLVPPGVQAMMSKYGYSIKVFPTHRTAAAPQYVYDNTAKNAVNAQLDPGGGRLGFTGAYGGVAFPIINTSDPLAGGAQVIWNHLLSWGGFCYSSPCASSVIVVNGVPQLCAGIRSRFRYPYYDPNGSVETFGGYFSYAHLYYTAPASVNGQEQLAWHSANVTQHPDITWQLLNGQARVRKAPNEQYDTPNPYVNGIASIDESSTFYGNPAQYDWRLIGKQEMFIPYNCNEMHFHTIDELFQPHFLNPDLVRWEKHRVWVVEATLHPGIHNVLSRRRYYMDEDSGFALLGEGYDGDGKMVKAYVSQVRAVPALPGVLEIGAGVHNLYTDDYCWAGTILQPNGSPNPTVFEELGQSFFDAQQMASNSAF